MQITLQQKEIEKAVTQYVTNQGLCTANKGIEISFKASRKNAQGESVNGYTAAIDIVDKPAQGPTPRADVDTSMLDRACEATNLKTPIFG